MSRAGNVFSNPVTGEFGYVRIGTEETNGALYVGDLQVRPGGAVVGEHIHPTIDERFTVIRPIGKTNTPPPFRLTPHRYSETVLAVHIR